MISPITNCFESKDKFLRVPTTRTVVCRPVEGASYAHHAAVTWYRGSFYVAWSCGYAHEDDNGQHIMLARSADYLNFPTVETIVPPQMGPYSEDVCACGGFFPHEKGLNLYFSRHSFIKGCEVWENRHRPELEWIQDFQHVTEEQKQALQKAVEEYGDIGLWCMTTVDGVHFSAPERLNIRSGMNVAPRPLASGRLLTAACCALFPYTDDPEGKQFKAAGMHLDDPNEPIEIPMRMQTLAVEKWGVSLCEPCFYQTDDGVIHMLLRCNNEQRLWVSESRDDGETWTWPIPTQFTNNCTKFWCGRLPDGRYCWVGSPVPHANRTPLCVSLSDDGVVFDRTYILRDEPVKMQFEGRFKGGDYAYPSVLIHDGRLFVAYTVCKEQVELVSVALSDLK